MGRTTSRPRVSVTLRDETYATLRRLSQANGESMSSILGGLVEATAPALERVAALVEAASGAQQEVLERLAESMTAAESTLSPLALEGQQEFLDLMTGLISEVQAGGPPPSNYGGHISIAPSQNDFTSSDSERPEQ